VIKTLDSSDIVATHTPGLLVNTLHLFRDLGMRVIAKHGGIRQFMGWNGAVISDSGGFQVMSLVKSTGSGKVTDHGVTFHPPGSKKITLTPESSIEFQLALESDIVVVLDDFTDTRATADEARESVERTILWAHRSKFAFESWCERHRIPSEKRPYLVAVVQGGDYLDLRYECTERLVNIGFDGLGYGGWPMKDDGTFNYDVATAIAKYTPQNYFLYGLGIGKPDEIARCVDLGYGLFDCVLPTRDARHKRLYTFDAHSLKEIDIQAAKFYSYYTPDKERFYSDTEPVSRACDCLLCTHYSRAYLAHLFRIEDATALRLATIHNLRFYSILMEKLQQKVKK
jgi:queuine tRNA-ribosyltransferase